MKKVILASAMALAMAAPQAQADAFWGAIGGGIGGAIIGDIIDGDEGAIDGALIGGTIGAIDGHNRSYGYSRSYSQPRYAPAPRRQSQKAAPQQQQRATSGRQLVKDVQVALQRLGYNPGPADGVPGKGTARALSQYKRANGLADDGVINNSLLNHMRTRGG